MTKMILATVSAWALAGAAAPAVAQHQHMFAVLVGFGDDRRDLARSGEQLGGLGVDDREILLFVGIDPALRGQLVDLALRDCRGGVAEYVQHLEAAVLDHQFEGAAEQEITDQDARRIAPDEVRRAFSAAHC